MGYFSGGVYDRDLVEQAVGRLSSEALDDLRRLDLNKLRKLLTDHPKANGREVMIDLHADGDSFFWDITSVMYNSDEDTVSVGFKVLTLLVERFRANGLLAEAWTNYEKSELAKLAFIKKELLEDAVR